MSGIRLAVPDTASEGEVIELKAMIKHPMESGYRRGPRGEVIERDIITRFECRYNDRLAFAAEYHAGVAANPIITFHIKADVSGDLAFKWIDQHGAQWSDTRTITVV